jgi:hypothetical protein
VRNTAGVEIAHDSVRVAVRGRSASVRTLVLPFALDRVDDIVSQLASSVGPVTQITLSIGLSHLGVQRVSLPPVSHDERRRMLALEPDRWFAAVYTTTPAISLVSDNTADGAMAMAADAAFVEACAAAFEAWGPVDRVEAAPVSLARALNARGRRSATCALDAAPGEVGLLTLTDGTLTSVRRRRDDGTTVQRLRVADSIAEEFSVAFGAALAADDDGDDMLLTPALSSGFASRARRAIAGWAAAAVVAVCAAVWAAGVSRTRVLDALDREIIQERSRAAVASGLALRAMAVDREIAVITSTTSLRDDPLETLAALGVRLPVHAVAQRVRQNGADWQIEGNAKSGAEVLASLAAEPRFDRVRFLAPSNRFRDGTTDRETFAIAFALR